VYSQVNALDWNILPGSGGILDQEEALWEDLLTIRGRYKLLKDLFEAGALTVEGGVSRDFRTHDSDARISEGL